MQRPHETDGVFLEVSPSRWFLIFDPAQVPGEAFPEEDFHSERSSSLSFQAPLDPRVKDLCVELFIPANAGTAVVAAGLRLPEGSAGSPSLLSW